MKKILVVLIILQTLLFVFLFLTVFKVDIPVRLVQNEISTAASETVILHAKVDLLEKHESWILTILGATLTVVTIVLGLIQWYFGLRAKEAVFKEMADFAKQDKEAFINSIKIKAIELELTTKYPIVIVSDLQDKTSKAKKLRKLLLAYHFKDVDLIEYKEADKHTFTSKSVVVFCDDSFDEQKSLEIIKNKKDIAVFGLGRGFDKLSGHHCINFANSFASVYNNLMSLLHYKRYLKSTTVIDNTQC